MFKLLQIFYVKVTQSHTIKTMLKIGTPTGEITAVSVSMML